MKRKGNVSSITIVWYLLNRHYRHCNSITKFQFYMAVLDYHGVRWWHYT